MLDIDTAIKHCLEVAEQNETQAEKWQEEGGEEWGKTTACRECAADHRQLAEWLQELRAYRKFRICGNCRHYVYGTTHFGECHVTSDIEPLTWKTLSFPEIKSRLQELYHSDMSFLDLVSALYWDLIETKHKYYRESVKFGNNRATLEEIAELKDELNGWQEDP